MYLYRPIGISEASIRSEKGLCHRIVSRGFQLALELVSNELRRAPPAARVSCTIAGGAAGKSRGAIRKTVENKHYLQRTEIVQKNQATD